MISNLKIIQILLLISSLLYACNDDEVCPKCHKDFVICKVNGIKWRSNCISNEPLFGCRDVSCYYYIKDDFGLNLSAGNSNNNSGITLDQGSAWGGAKLGNNSIQKTEFGFINFSLNGNCSRLDSIDFSYNNYLILDKIDTINYLLEGRFGYRDYNLCGDTATITDGRFNTRYFF